jgi:hypothetical protein
VYLREAHQHEKPPELDRSIVPNQDIEIREEFLEQNEMLMAFIAVALFEGARGANGATDWDMREALDSLIRRYRVLQSGLYIESRPVNPYSAAIVDEFGKRIETIQEEVRSSGEAAVPDAAILTILALFQRLEYSRNNGRKRSRAFIDFLDDFYRPLQERGEELAESTGEPRIII